MAARGCGSCQGMCTFQGTVNLLFFFFQCKIFYFLLIGDWLDNEGLNKFWPGLLFWDRLVNEALSFASGYRQNVGTVLNDIRGKNGISISERPVVATLG